MAAFVLNRYIFVEFEQLGNCVPSQTFEVEMSNDEEKSDTALLLQAIIDKKPKLADVITHGEVLLKKESEIFPGKFIDIEEHSTIKDKSIVKCIVSKKLQDLNKSVVEEGVSTQNFPQWGKSKLQEFICLSITSNNFELLYLHISFNHQEMLLDVTQQLYYIQCLLIQ